METNGKGPVSSVPWALIDPLFKKCISAVVLNLFHYIDTVFVIMKDKGVLLPTTILVVCSIFWNSEYIKLVGFWLYCLIFFDSNGVVFSYSYF